MPSGHRVDLLVAIPILPVSQLRRQVAKQRNRIRGLRAATLVGRSDSFKQDTVEQVDVEIRRGVLASMCRVRFLRNEI